VACDKAGGGALWSRALWLFNGNWDGWNQLPGLVNIQKTDGKIIIFDG